MTIQDFPNHIPTRTIPSFVRSVDASFPHDDHITAPPNAQQVSRWVEYMNAAGAARRPLTTSQRGVAESIWAAYDEKTQQRAADEESLLANGRGKNARRQERREDLIRRTRRFLIRSPFAPLFFRIWIVLDSVIALGIATDILRHDRPCRDTATHLLAIIIHVVAVPYTLYIAWDEFISKPLGLRRPSSKLRLLTLDLFFIVFESANLSLAFNVGTDGSSDKKHDGTSSGRCGEQWGLVVVILIALISWISTFLLSLFRLMYKMEGLQ